MERRERAARDARHAEHSGAGHRYERLLGHRRQRLYRVPGERAAARDLGARGESPRRLGLLPGRYTVIAELSGYYPAQAMVENKKLGSSVTRIPASWNTGIGERAMDQG